MLCLIFTSLFVLTNAYRTFDLDGEETILAIQNEQIEMRCKSDYPVENCTFEDPFGNSFSFTDRAVRDGQCVHEITVEPKDSGVWTCHTGSKLVQLETIRKIHVRVVGPLAAIQKTITAKLGEPTTLSCVTTEGFIPLSYCRFKPPNTTAFGIDHSITDSNAIFGRFVYPTNKSLDRGDCAVTIREVKMEDAGHWLCWARVENRRYDSDIISLKVEGYSHITSILVTLAIAFGVFLVGGCLCYIIYRKGKFRLLGVQENQQDTEMRVQFRSVPQAVVMTPSTSSNSGSPSMPNLITVEAEVHT